MRERSNWLLRFFDFYFGIPLVVLLGFFKRLFSFRQKECRIDFSKCGKLVIGILKEAAIGDFVILSGVIMDIARNIPDATLIICCSSENKNIVDLLDVNLPLKVFVIPMTNIFKILRVVFSLPEMDFWLDFGQWPRINAVISFFVKAKCKVGFRTRNQYRHYVYDVVVEHSKDRNELDNFRSIVEAIGLKTGSMPHLKVINEKIDIPEKFVVFHMFPGGSRAHLKIWPEENWKRLAVYLIDKGFRIILTGSRRDSEKAQSFINKLELSDDIKDVVLNRAGIWNLKETVYALSKAVCVVSVDTSIVHIASAINANLIALYGPTSPKRWGPMNKNARLITASIPCSPCLNLGFESKCKKNRCMEMIRSEEVIKQLESLISG